MRSELLDKFTMQVDAPLPVLWYNHLLQDGDQTRQKIYEEVVITTEASHGSTSMALMKLIVA